MKETGLCNVESDDSAGSADGDTERARFYNHGAELIKRFVPVAYSR